jgi:integrase
MPTKSGAERPVDISAALSEDLDAWSTRAAAIALQRGVQASRWLFRGRTEAPRSHRRLERAFKAVLKQAGLPGHFTPHSLRHSYASIQLARGVSIYYVQRQLGHASIQMTVDHYGRWLPATNPGAADDLEVALGGEKSPRSHQPARRPAVSGGRKGERIAEK